MSTSMEAAWRLLHDRIAACPELAGLNLPALARPSVRLATRRAAPGEVGLGQSRIGGIPDVPPDFEWPRWKPPQPRQDRLGEPWDPKEPTPLGFISQIDLGAIPSVDDLLPGSGWLYFFYDRYCEPWGFDPLDRSCCRAFYSNCDRSDLRRTPPPSDADPEHDADSCVVDSRPELTIPDKPLEIECETPQDRAYDALLEELHGSSGATHHRLLGHPQIIQNAMELECQLASNGVYCGDVEGYRSDRGRELAVGASEWRLLLQIDTDEEGPGWIWGDVGRLYFWIKRADLASRRFDHVWLILQCY